MMMQQNKICRKRFYHTITLVICITFGFALTSCLQPTRYHKNKYRAKYNTSHYRSKNVTHTTYRPPTQYTPEGYAILPLKSLIPSYTTPKTNLEIKVFTPTYQQTLHQKKMQPTVNKIRTHQVAPGETLSKIAKRYYFDPKQYQKIIKANPSLQNNPNILKPGMTLIIP